MILMQKYIITLHLDYNPGLHEFERLFCQQQHKMNIIDLLLLYCIALDCIDATNTEVTK